MSNVSVFLLIVPLRLTGLICTVALALVSPAALARTDPA